MLDRAGAGDGVGEGVDAPVEEVLDDGAQLVDLAGGVHDQRQAAVRAGGVVEPGDRLPAGRVHGDLVGDQPDRARPPVAHRSSVEVRAIAEPVDRLEHALLRRLADARRRGR